MGFLEEIKEIVRQCPKTQTLLFSGLTARQLAVCDEKSGETFGGVLGTTRKHDRRGFET